jgi:RHS repeat-associated protein
MAAQHAPAGDYSTRYKFNGKELDQATGLYYYGARYYDPKISTWLSVDPLAEKYQAYSPYNYTLNNPINLIDPDGRSVDDVIIKGNKSQEALEQLQLATNGELAIIMNSEGKLSAFKTTKETLSKGANDLLDAIYDSSITVNISATDNDFISDNSAPLLGAFMGNTVESSQSIASAYFNKRTGNFDYTFVNNVSAYQEINPEALGRMDVINGSPGQNTLHEVTESYFGGKISQQNGFSVGKATLADKNNPKSVYSRAHKSAIDQSGTVTERFYNSSGTEVFRGNSNFQPTKLQYLTGSSKQVFHTVPKK